MSPRSTGEERRAQIALATLDLLGTHPLAELTTRRIAAHVGLTQPGLFRHFLGRDRIVLAAIDLLREELGALAAASLDPPLAPLRAIETLVVGLVGTAARRPGLPRLLLQDLGAGQESPFRAPLAHLVSMQHALLTEHTRRAISAGELPPVAPAEAAGLLVGFIQGVLLRRLQAGREGGAEADARLLVAVWSRGLQAMGPAEVPEPPPVEPAARELLARFDTGDLLGKGVDPLGAILGALDHLAPRGVLVILAPFRPTPLIALLRARGHTVEDREPSPGAWVVEVRTPGAPEPLDLRHLPAPEPMQQALEAVARLGPGGAFFARTPKVPHLLARELQARGLQVATLEEADGTGLVYVLRSAG